MVEFCKQNSKIKDYLMDKKTQEKLNILERTVQEQAQFEATALNNETDKKLAEEITSIKLSFEKANKDKFSSNLKGLGQDVNKQSFLIETEYKKRVLEKREEIVNKIMDAVLGKVNGFIEAPEYREYLVKNIGDAVRNIGEKKFVVYITQRDGERYFDYIRGKFNGIEMKPKEGIIGGCVAEGEGLIIDNSIKGKIEEQRDKLSLMII